jgi:DNA-binding transcriptional MerR regulator
MAASSGRYHLTLAHPAGESAVVPSAAETLAKPFAAAPMQLGQVSSERGECSPQPLLRVGDLAKMTGKTVRAIHHYEELGLIEPAGRSKGHYRLFDVDTPVRIRWIGKLQSLGLSLGEIRTLVRTRQASPSALQAAGHLRRMYEEKLVEVRSRLAELTALERELSASLSYLDACGTSCAPELGPTDCAQCDRHAEEQHSDLISGALV